MKYTDPYELTPVEEHNGMLFKRDDLFMPYEDIELGGGKVRQLIYLLNAMEYDLKHNYAGLVTYCSASSPQSIIIAKEANVRKLKSVLCIGKDSKPENLKAKYIPIRLAVDYGCEIRDSAASSRNNSKKKESLNIAKKEKLCLVHFGIASEKHIESVISAVAEQVQNIPNKLDALIVPTGSGITLAGILIGLKRYNKIVRKVIAIQISNNDRIKEINKILYKYDLEPKYEFHTSSELVYHKLVVVKINDDFFLNKVYEAKAYKYFLENREELGIKENSSNLFWCVGNNNFLFGGTNEK